MKRIYQVENYLMKNDVENKDDDGARSDVARNDGFQDHDKWSAFIIENEKTFDGLEMNNE